MLLDVMWWAGWAWCAAWIALPLLAVPVLGPAAGAFVWALLAPWSALAGSALLHRLLPPAVTGTFRLPGERGATLWALKGFAPSTFLTLFQPLFFTCRGFQRIALRAFGAELGEGAWITSRTIVREPHHVRVGARSLVGEYAHLVCSYQPRPGLLVVADIVIGDDTLIGAYAHLAPGAHVGSRCIVEHAVAIGAHSRIGDGARVGAGTAIYNHVSVGAGARIGKNCVILSGSRIAEGAQVPDGTVLTAERAAIARAAP